MSERLKPCPFCGGMDVNLRQHLATNMSWVSCGECGLEAPSETGWTDDHAIEYWNTRNDAEIKELRAKLFPYADATEISGISWDGKYLIGDNASIRFFHEMKNRGEQIDVYKRAYDERLAAKDAEIAKLREALTFYSKRENWIAVETKGLIEAGPFKGHYQTLDNSSPAEADGGNRARAVLGEKAE